jgi:hypothetical protein
VRHSKIIGLAVVAALAITALVGVTQSGATTSSTVLCKAPELACSAANTYGPGTHIEAVLKSGTEAKLTGALAISCKNSTVLGELTTGLGTTQLGIITSLTFSNCNTCESITSTGHYGSGWISHLKNLGSLKGSLTVLSPLVLLNNCTFFKISCVASSPEVSLDVDPDGSGGLTILAVNESLNLGICGNGTWNAEYVITLPKPAYIEG